MFSATGLELKTALKLANFELGSVDADSYIHIKWEQIKLIIVFQTIKSQNWGVQDFDFIPINEGGA